MQTDIDGIVNLLSRHLYSSPGIFVREFLQNAADSIAARSVEDSFAPRRIDVRLTKAKGKKPAQITFTDSGAGLTPEEIRSKLLTIGGTSKGENDCNTDYIGKFGLGILSGFMVSDSIEFKTRPLSDNAGCILTARLSGYFRIDSADVKNVGSSVTLRCKKGFDDYFTENTLKDLLCLYGNILPYPVYFSAEGSLTVLINEIAPPWLTPGISTSEEIIAYGENYFGERFMGYIPLKSESGGVEGVAYILNRRAAPGSKGNHRVYLRNILLTDKGEGFLPGWAFFLRAVVNVYNLTPALSRENFYEDDLLNKTRVELGNCIKNFFDKLSVENTYLMDRFLTEHLIGLKIIALEDKDILQTFMDYFPFETSFGTFSFREIKAASRRIGYVNKVDEFRQLSSVFGAGRQMLINAGYAYDAELMAMLSFYNPNMRIGRLDSGDVIPAMRELDFEEVKKYAELEKTASKFLSKWGCVTKIRRFRPEELPVLFLVNEEALFVSNIKHDKEGGGSVFDDLFSNFDNDDDKPSVLLCLNAENNLINQMTELGYNNETGFNLLYFFGILMARRQLGDKELAAFNGAVSSLIKHFQTDL
jgi:molecular chaperone HtpG